MTETNAKAAHRAAYEEGSRATLLSLYLALADFGLPGINWISDRLSGAPKTLDPATTAEVEHAVTLSVIEHMRGYNPQRAAQLEKSFADFLAGDSESNK